MYVSNPKTFPAGRRPVRHFAMDSRVAFSLSIILAFCGQWSVAFAQPQNTPRTGIVDLAGVIDSKTEAGLNKWLLELEQKTTAQLKVLTIDTTHGRDIHSFGLEMAKRWRLGQEGKNNGALIVIAVRDRRYNFAIGEGIEDTLPDLYCDSIAQKYFVPNFKRGDFGTGIYQGTVAVARKIAADSGASLSGAPPAPVQRMSRSRRRGRRGGIPCFTMFILLMVFGRMFGGRRRRNHGAWSGGGFLQGMLLASLFSSFGRGGGGSSWGGGGGGFGGGFGGGGGGSFGGGGCSGGW